MDVSVIFATYNRESILESVFAKWEEVLQATTCSFEIICSDDESSDGTVDIIEKAQKKLPIKLIKNKKGGAGRARNEALKIAEGKLVIFTGDDMYPEKDFVNQHYANYRKYGENIATLGKIDWHDDVPMNYLMYHITDVGCEQFGFKGLPPYQFVDFRHFYTSNISVPKSLLDKQKEHFSSKFDKYGFEDIELGYRLCKSGMKIFYDPDIIVFHHHIYDSVDKFCDRQKNAGEELVVCYRIHNDLEDKCVCDIENCEACLNKYISQSKINWSLSGSIIQFTVWLSKKITKILDEIIKKKDENGSKKICSLLYAGLFQYSFLFGCVTKIAEREKISKSKRAKFLYQYMKRGFAQLYWDIGEGINEKDSRKWIIWNSEEVILEKNIPHGVKKIRFTPMKNKCIADIQDIFFENKMGNRKEANVVWHNARTMTESVYDFRNTIDPMIMIENIPSGYEKIVIRMSVKDMRKSKVISELKRVAGILYKNLTKRKERVKDTRIEYAYGQSRKIQIGVFFKDKKHTEELVEEYKEHFSMFNDSILISPKYEMKRDYTNYYYSPQIAPLDKVQLMQIAYLLLNYAYDFVITSKSLVDWPQIGGDCLEDVLVISSDINTNAEEWMLYATGKYLRLPSMKKEQKSFLIADKFSKMHLNNGTLNKINGKNITCRLSDRICKYEKNKKMIFVLPIFLAVGGVERNTIEVMRQLKKEYEFCLITMERHSFLQGSLHYQLEGICDHIFDLAELVDSNDYLKILFELNRYFEPDLIWLCNNSPWLESNMEYFRKVFSNIPIIAQDVYDIKEGWITYYNEKGMKTVDRYIAITELIKDTFIQKYDIPIDKIDVIYPVVDDKQILEARNSSISKKDLCEKFGLDMGKRYFATVGRLTEQKNPLRYLKLISEVADKFTDVRFIMVGEGVLEANVEQFIEKKKLGKYLTRIPYIKNVPEFMKVLDGLLILSNYEGMPIVSIEAMSLGIPIMSTDVGDVRRFLKKTKGGMIVDDTRSDENNFMLFVNDLSAYKKNAEKAKDDILEFFSVNYQGKRYIDCFEKGMLRYQTDKEI